MTNKTFQPICLLMPSSTDWEQARSKVSDPTEPVEVLFGLSHKPHPTWQGFFFKAWRIWYDVPPPAIFGTSLMITCIPSKISIYRGMAQATISEANAKSAPLIVDEDALANMHQKRKERIYQLEQEQAQPVSLPNNRQGEQLCEMLRQKHHTDRTNLLKEIAQDEMDRVMTRMIDEDLLRSDTT